MRPRSSTLALTLVLQFAACLPIQAPLHAPNLPGTWYKVKPGDTPASIAQKQGIPLEDVLEINGLRRDDVLEDGQIIFLVDPQATKGKAPRPGEPPPPEPPPPAWATEPPTPVPAGPALLRWPLRHPSVSSPFGFRKGKVHEGIDLAAPIGTPVLAARDGVVLYAGDAVRGYGNMIVLQHPGDMLTVYAHNSLLLVRTGDRVKVGQEIARVGQSGRASAPHLHFEVRNGQVPQDPVRFLPRR